MKFLSCLIIFLLSTRTVNAQIPLFYQLLEAYHPTVTNQTTLNPLPAATLTTTTPSPAGQILGVSSTTPPLINFQPSLHQNVGGEGRTITMAVLGDSMIDTLKPGLPQLQQSLAKYYPDKKFNLLNYGFGSSDIEYGLYRLTNNYDYQGVHFDSLVAQKPDLIVLESFAYNNFGNTESGINRHRLTLGTIITTLKQKLPNVKIVIAATIAPNSVVFANGIKDLHFSALEKIEKTTTIKLYLQNTVNFANSQSLPLADAYHLSLFNNEGLLELINSSDHLHPSSAGGTLFCDVIADTIFKNKLID